MKASGAGKRGTAGAENGLRAHRPAHTDRYRPPARLLEPRAEKLARGLIVRAWRLPPQNRLQRRPVPGSAGTGQCPGTQGRVVQFAGAKNWQSVQLLDGRRRDRAGPTVAISIRVCGWIDTVMRTPSRKDSWLATTSSLGACKPVMSPCTRIRNSRLNSGRKTPLNSRRIGLRRGAAAIMARDSA